MMRRASAENFPLRCCWFDVSQRYNLDRSDALVTDELDMRSRVFNVSMNLENAEAEF